jgi:hypothetical protein
VGLSIILSACASAETPQATGDIVVTDLWDRPHDLRSISAGKPTLLFICDPALTKCREGAVHFDSQAERIEVKKIKPVCILLASPDDARETAFKMDLAVPVYVDADRLTISGLIHQDVLPAMVLLDGKGNVTKIMLGGGESLDSNLTAMLETRHAHRWRFLSALIPVAIFGIILLVLE